jgi:hypothetical protein
MAKPGNAIQPGMVVGDRIRWVIDAKVQALRVSDEAIRRRLAAKLRRAGWASGTMPT